MTEWTHAAIERMRALWDAGGTLNSIARELGVTRNVVAGIARRQGFASRPSPIKRCAPVQAEPAKAKRKPTLPPLRSLDQWTPPPAPRVFYSEDVTPFGDIAPPPGRLTPSAVDPNAARLAGVQFRPLPTSECCWPIGNPGTKKFRFCCAPSRPGKPYCAKHYDIAYVRKGQSDAA